MIRINVEECKWGTDVFEDGSGLQINFLDEQSGLIFHVPMVNSALTILASEIIDVIDEEQQKELLDKLKPKQPARKRKPKATT